MRLKSSLLSAIAILAAVACTKENKGVAGETGCISFAVANDGAVVEQTKANVSDFTTLPSAASFTIKVVNSEGAAVYNGTVADWDVTTQLPVGNYSVEAVYGASDIEGFDKPFFTGSQNFAVTGGQTTAVSIPVALGNTIVRVTCSEMFRNYFPEYSFKLTRNNADIVAFAQGETRAAFVDGYNFTLEGSFTNAVAKTTTFKKEYTNMDEKTCYTFAFDASNVGGVKVTISFNDTVEEIDLGETELND